MKIQVNATKGEIETRIPSESRKISIVLAKSGGEPQLRPAPTVHIFFSSSTSRKFLPAHATNSTADDGGVVLHFCDLLPLARSCSSQFEGLMTASALVNGLP